MHFTTTTFTTIVIAFALGTDAVKIRKSRPLYGRQDKIAEPGDECFEPGGRVCTGDFKNGMICLGPPGATLNFAIDGAGTCIEGFTVCVDGSCQVDESLIEDEPTATVESTAIPAITCRLT